MARKTEQQKLEALFRKQLKEESGIKSEKKFRKEKSKTFAPLKRGHKNKKGVTVFQEIFRDEKGKIISEKKYYELITEALGHLPSENDFREITGRTFSHPEGITVYEMARRIREEKKAVGERPKIIEAYVPTKQIKNYLEVVKEVYANDRKTSKEKMVLEISLGLGNIMEILRLDFDAVSIIELTSEILTKINEADKDKLFLYSNMKGLFYIRTKNEGDYAIAIDFNLKDMSYDLEDTYGKHIE